MVHPNQHQQNIIDFHRRFNRGYEGPPRILDRELAHFRIKFLAEEVKELGHELGVEMDYSLAISKRIIVPTSDTLAKAIREMVDVEYVLRGTVHLSGMDMQYEPAWLRVHHSNMLKIPASSVNPGSRGSPQYDVVKPIGWTAPNLVELFS